MNHQQEFERFLRVKFGVGEVYSHLRTLTYGVRNESPEDRLRAYGYFVAFYEPGAAYYTLKMREEPLEEWLAENWTVVRPQAKERLMVVGNAAKMAQCIRSLDDWLVNADERLWKLEREAPDAASLYESVFAEVRKVKFIGRYMGIRMSKAICDNYLHNGESDKVFAKGGKFIRQGFEILYPEYRGKLGPETPDTIRITEELGFQEQARLAEADLAMTKSELSEMLCDYRRMINGKAYIGIQFDDRLPGILRGEQAGCNMDALWESRKDQYAHACLGEFHGWDGVREGLKDLYVRTHIVFDDRKHDWRYF